MAGWILRVFKGRGRQLLVPLLKQLIIPRLEYCSIIWSPGAQVQISSLKTVQRTTQAKYIMREDHPTTGIDLS